MKNAEKLIKDIKRKKDQWDERSQFELKGVGNLSNSDLDELDLYANTYKDNGGSFQGLSSPLGDVKEVLDAYGLEDKFGSIF